MESPRIDAIIMPMNLVSILSTRNKFGIIPDKASQGVKIVWMLDLIDQIL